MYSSTSEASVTLGKRRSENDLVHNMVEWMRSQKNMPRRFRGVRRARRARPRRLKKSFKPHAEGTLIVKSTKGKKLVSKKKNNKFALKMQQALCPPLTLKLQEDYVFRESKMGYKKFRFLVWESELDLFAAHEIAGTQLASNSVFFNTATATNNATFLGGNASYMDIQLRKDQGTRSQILSSRCRLTFQNIAAPTSCRVIIWELKPRHDLPLFFGIIGGPLNVANWAAVQDTFETNLLGHYTGGTWDASLVSGGATVDNQNTQNNVVTTGDDTGQCLPHVSVFDNPNVVNWFKVKKYASFSLEPGGHTDVFINDNRPYMYNSHYHLSDAGAARFFGQKDRVKIYMLEISSQEICTTRAAADIDKFDFAPFAVAVTKKVTYDLRGIPRCPKQSEIVVQGQGHHMTGNDLMAINEDNDNYSLIQLKAA